MRPPLPTRSASADGNDRLVTPLPPACRYRLCMLWKWVASPSWRRGRCPVRIARQISTWMLDPGPGVRRGIFDARYVMMCGELKWKFIVDLGVVQVDRTESAAKDRAGKQAQRRDGADDRCGLDVHGMAPSAGYNEGGQISEAVIARSCLFDPVLTVRKKARRGAELYPDQGAVAGRNDEVDYLRL